MSIHIQARGFALTESLQQHTLKRIKASLGSRLDNVTSVHVGLSDINGPRGGADKCCRVHISLHQQRDVVVEDIQRDMYSAINSALRRARNAVGRRFSKLRAGASRRLARAQRLEPVSADTAV